MTKLIAMVSMYDSGEWIENRLNNLLQSTMINDMEIWCINANSPDERDHDIPSKLAQQHKQIKYEKLAKRNTVYEAWNYIIEKTQSTYITNANTDDIVAPQCYATLINTLENNATAGLSYCSWYTTGRPNNQWDNLIAAAPDGRPGHYSGNIDIAGVGHFPLWKRTLHSSLGLFDTKYQALADADWWARIHYVAKKQFIWVNQPLAVYLWRSGHNLWHQKMQEMNKAEWDRYHKKISVYKQGKLE